ncbi:MAG: hypothetical protein GKR91_06950 [Pseudomonadales bacterium]|nr:hypothetical protein [Pseudomonadales bacterium]
MKNPNLVAKVSLSVLAIVLVIIFLAAIVIPNMVEESPDQLTFTSLTSTSNGS